MKKNEFFSFLNHSKNYITAGLFEKGVSIITVPIFTRLLVPSEYGIISVLGSFITIFEIIYGLSIRGAILRYYYENLNDFDGFLGSNVIMILGWSVILTIFMFLFSDVLLWFFNVPIGIIYIGIGVTFFQVFFTIFENYLQATKNSKKVAKLTIYKRILTILVSIPAILVLSNDKYYGRAYGILFVAIIFGLYSLFKIWELSSLTFKLKHIKYSLLFSLPIILHHLSSYLLGTFDQIIINQLVGSKETGFYSIAYSVGGIQSMISHGMLRAWAPIFYEKLNLKSFEDINRLASKFSRLVFLSAFILTLFGSEVVTILADKKYHEALDIIPIIVISYVFFFLYTMYVNFAFYRKKTHLIAIFTIIAGGINIGLNYWLIPIFGYKVAAWTSLISYMALFILHYINVKFIIKQEWVTDLRVFLPNFLILIIIINLYYLIINIVTEYFLILVIKILLCLVIILIYFGKEYFKKRFSFK